MFLLPLAPRPRSPLRTPSMLPLPSLLPIPDPSLTPALLPVPSISPLPVPIVQVPSSKLSHIPLASASTKHDLLAVCVDCS